MKVLIIEKSNEIPRHLVRKIRTRYGNDVEIVAITQAEYNKRNIANEIQSVDVVAADTQLANGSQFLLLKLLPLFYQLNSKEIYLTGHQINKSLYSLLEQYCENDINPYDPMLVNDPIDKFNFLCSKICHHKVIDGVENKEMKWVKEKGEQHKNWEERRLLYLNNLESKKTDQKIVLGNLSSAPSWVSSSAKRGDILFSYDLKEIDENPKRRGGVWTVIGGKPIKLLSDGQYREFSFIEHDIPY